jgi:hypothetical protein
MALEERFPQAPLLPEGEADRAEASRRAPRSAARPRSGPGSTRAAAPAGSRRAPRRPARPQLPAAVSPSAPGLPKPPPTAPNRS